MAEDIEVKGAFPVTVAGQQLVQHDSSAALIELCPA